jgi:hypothetical protein
MLFRSSIEGIMKTKMERQKSTSSFITLADIGSFFECFPELGESEFIGSGGSITHFAEHEDADGGGRARSDSIHSINGIDIWFEFEDTSNKVGLLQKPTNAHSRRSSFTGISSLSGGMNDFPMDVLDDCGFMDYDFGAVKESLTSDPVIPCIVSSSVGQKELADQNFCKLFFDIQSAKNKLIRSMGGSSLIPDVIKSLPEKEDIAVTEIDKSAHFHKVIPTVNVTLPPKEVKPKKKNENRYYNRVPKQKIYSPPKELDVLLGRGGHVNNHIGNKMYLDKKMELQDSYTAATKEDKTGISQELVDAVHNWGGKFLKEDDVGWYQVENIIARKKASQTLRERDDRAKKKVRKQFDGGT